MSSDEPEHPDHETPDAPPGLSVSALDTAAEAGAVGARGRGRTWRWGLRLGGGVALLALLAVVAVAISPLIPRPAPPKSQPPPSLAVVPLQLPSGAPSDFTGEAWSPDGRSIALVLDSSSDPGATTNPSDSTALIFDSHSGQFLNGFPLDRMILPANAPSGAQVALRGVIWTADNQRIAVLFTVLEPDQNDTLSPTADGLALLTVRGPSLGRIVFSLDSPLIQPGAVPQTRDAPREVGVWDTYGGGLARQQRMVVDSLAYRWTDNGALVAMPSASAPGDLSLWRDGQLTLVNAFVCAGDTGKPQERPYLELSLSTLAWSPSEQYLTSLNATRSYDVPAVNGPTPTPGPVTLTGACSAGPAYDSLEPGPRHDAGLVAAEALAASPNNSWAGLEWSPNGQRLAVFPFNMTGAGGAILIYDCHTGKLITRVTASQIALSGQPGSGPAKNFDTIFTGGVWSPDGRSLLIEASGVGARPFVLGPRALQG